MSKSSSSEAIFEGMVAAGSVAVLSCAVEARVDPAREIAERSRKGRGWTQREVRESSR